MTLAPTSFTALKMALAMPGTPVILVLKQKKKVKKYVKENDKDINARKTHPSTLTASLTAKDVVCS